MSFLQMFLVIGLVLAAIQGQAKPKPVLKKATQQVSAPGGCKKVAAELKAMRQAQQTLLNSMAQNNDTMAQTLEQYAGEFKQKSNIKRRPISSKDIQSMHQSAEAFRSHKSREQKLIARFDFASEQLISKVESCLKPH